MIDPRIRYAWKTFYQVPFLVPFWGAEEMAAVRRATWRSSPDDRRTHRDELESALGRLGFDHVVLTPSGSAAIEVALRCLDRTRGEVIVPTFGCQVVVDAVIRAGYVPVFADINDDLTLSAASVAANLTPDTAAVLVAHLSGKPAADMAALVELCRGRNIALLDDAAQALGVAHDGRPLGSCGDFGILSFGLGKPTFSLGGGALVVRSRDAKIACERIAASLARPASRWAERRRVADFLMQYRWRRYTLPFFSACRLAGKAFAAPARPARQAPMTELEAELQLIQLSKLREITSKFASNGRRLQASLRAANSPLQVPQAADDCGFTKVVLRAPAGATRPLAAHLLKKGIEIEWSYRPLDGVHTLARFRRHPNPVANAIWRDLIAVPAHPALTPAQVECVSSAVGSFGRA